jgi:D-alanyl-D-alanine carboxypeptidase
MGSDMVTKGERTMQLTGETWMRDSKRMGHRRLALGIVGLAVTLVGPGCTGEGTLTPLVPPTLERVSTPLQRALDTWAEQSGHRGVSASVILANGDEWAGAAGQEALGSPLRPEHLIAIASITKTMTAAVILQLAGETVLGLDDPISTWLSAIPNVDPQITIRQLLNHTSGVANYTANSALGAALDADPLHPFTPDELLTYAGPAAFTPGARTQYTNTGFLLLGLIAEAATGDAITDLYEERLWTPLGLTEVFLPVAQPAPGPLAISWAGTGAATAVAPLDEPSLLTIGQSAFGLFASARDVARWGRALFAGSILTPELRSEMQALVPAAGNIPGESGAGLGIRSYGYLGRTQYGHSGGFTLGSSLLLFDPGTGVTVTVLMNQGSGADHFALAPRLLAIAAGG